MNIRSDARLRGALGALLLLFPPGSSTAASTPAGVYKELVGSGLDFRHFNGMRGDFNLPEITCGGGALFDYDNDGDLDVFLPQGSVINGGHDGAGDGAEGTPPSKPPIFPLPEPPGDRLFRNDLTVLPGGGRRVRFTDVSRGSGIAGAGGYGCGVATGDYDGDGWVDLYLTRLGPDRLLRNQGDGIFADVTAKSGAGGQGWSTSASFSDYDGDGFPDLFVTAYVDWSPAKEKVCRTASGARDYCNPAAYTGIPNRLLRNLGDGTFEDVSKSSGVGRLVGKSLGVIAADFNGDGRRDYYVTNDGEANHLWLQTEGGAFRESALFAGCALNATGRAEASMGIDAADVDGDGDPDLFLTHLVSETNTFYLNDGEGNFTDRTTRAALGAASWPMTSWGTVFTDFDLDGVLDLAVANGAVRTLAALADAGDPFPFSQPNQLYRGVEPAAETPRFSEVGDGAGEALRRSEVSRGLSAGDIDNDGDEDLLLVNNSGPARILLNREGQDRSWLGLRLVDGSADGPVSDALGARVALLRPGKKPRWREVRTDGSFASARDPRIRFGLGDGSGPSTVRVHWPDGRVEEWQNLPPGRYFTLRAGRGTVPKTVRENKAP